MFPVRWSSQGQCRKSSLILSLFIDEFEGEMVLPVPVSRLGIDGLSPVGTNRRGKEPEVVFNELPGPISALQNGNAEVVVGSAVVEWHSITVSRQHTQQY